MPPPCSDPSKACWRLLTMTIQQRPFVAYGWSPVDATSYPLRVGGTIRHWAAPEDAIGWFRYAAAQMTEQNVNNVAHASPQAQADYLRPTLQAIANGFNCLNIAWQNDPQSRALYRKWIAGPPGMPGGSPRTSLFAQDLNYSGNEWGWFTRHGDAPVVDPRYDLAGLIPQDMYRRFAATGNTAYSQGMVFVPAVGFDLSPAPDTIGAWDGLPESVELQSDVINSMFFQFSGIADCPAGLAYPRQCGPGANNMGGAAGWSGFAVESVPFNIGGNALRATIGPAAYFPYLREWMAAMVARTGTQIIQDARAFVVFTNANFARQAGGTAAFMRDAMEAPLTIVAEATHPDAAIEGIAQAAFAIGGALATETYGISALVGGTVGGALMVANRTVRRTVTGRGRDDLGRWKPTMERAYLSGDPNASDHDAWPNFTAPAAPVAFKPGRDPLVLTVIPPWMTGGASPGDVQTTTEPLPFGKIALGAGLAFAGWQVWKYYKAR